MGMVVQWWGSAPSVWMVAGSNRTLATMEDLGQVLHSQLPVALQHVNSDTVSML